MALAMTTTLRVPIELRDEIARLADARGTTMLDVVTDAIHRLTRAQWWDSVHEALDEMSDEEVAAHQAQTAQLDHAAADGLRGS
jgi:predicted transcriptional regulator